MRCPIICSPFILMIPPQVVAKTGPTLHTRERTLRARKLCRSEDWAIKLREEAEAGAARWLAMSDEDLWDFILDAEVPRALNVHFGIDCPVHGTEVFRKGGHYPWIMSSDEAFKVKCPVGGEVYPNVIAERAAEIQEPEVRTRCPDFWLLRGAERVNCILLRGVPRAL